MKRIGVLTSGGDAPGMNAAIRAVTRAAIYHNIEVKGILNGFEGMIENKFINLKFSDVGNIIQRGGTILGSARSMRFLEREGRLQAAENLQKSGIEGLIVIGGNGSFTGAHQLFLEHQIPFIGIPGTIDNDLFGTDFTIGFDSALNTVVEAVDKIRDTASSHHRVFFVEVMGRHSGFIALDAGISVGAEDALIPEIPNDINTLVNYLKRIRGKKRSSIILVSEGETEGGAIEIMKKVQNQLPDFDMRTSVLGHMQRGGNPSAMDRILASRMGVKAIENLILSKSDCMVGFKNNEIQLISIHDAINKKEQIDVEKLKVMQILSHY
jgi:6-phosphofructokinase 1